MFLLLCFSLLRTLLLSLLQVEELERVKVELERERKYTAELLEQVRGHGHEYTRLYCSSI